MPVDSAQQSLSLGARILTATGAAVVGAGLGFFASQIARGDWEDAGPEGRPIDRQLWAAIGGGVGFAVGFRFPLASMGQAAEQPDRFPTGRDRLGAKEILDSKAVNGYEAVKLLRPEWLVLRGHQTLVQPSGHGLDGSQPRKVYIESHFIGGLEALRTIPAQDIGAAYFLDAAAATHRLGGGHPQGAILVVLAG